MIGEDDSDWVIEAHFKDITGLLIDVALKMIIVNA